MMSPEDDFCSPPGVIMSRNYPLSRLLALSIVTAAPACLLITAASAEMLPPGGIAQDLATSLGDQPDLGGELKDQKFVDVALADSQGQVFYTGSLLQNVVQDLQ